MQCHLEFGHCCAAPRKRNVDRIVIQILLEGINLEYSVPIFIPMQPLCPGHIPPQCQIVSAQVVVDHHAFSLMVVAHQEISIHLPSDAENLASGCDGQRHYSNGLECLRMFRECPVMGDNRHVETEFQSKRTSIAKSPSGYQGDLDAAITRPFKCLSSTGS